MARTAHGELGVPSVLYSFLSTYWADAGSCETMVRVLVNSMLFRLSKNLKNVFWGPGLFGAHRPCACLGLITLEAEGRHLGVRRLTKWGSGGGKGIHFSPYW